MMLPRVLVLDGETTQALACVRSLGRAGYRILVASRGRRPLAAWSRHCAASVQIRDATPAAFKNLREWASAQGVSVVLPLTEWSCRLCNAERPIWEALGMVLGCPADELLDRAFDKARTVQYAQASGVRVPVTHVPQSLADCRLAAAEVGFPCVVKPRFSHAWDGTAFLPDVGTLYAHDQASFEAAVQAGRQGSRWPLVQSVVEGVGKGVFALCQSGRVVAWFAHERLRDVRPSGSGSALRRSVSLDPRLREPAERLLAEMRWDGPAMVEFRDDGVGAPCLMEVNGRFWGSLELAVSSGADFPRWWVEILLGVRPLVTAYRVGVTIRWIWGDVKRLLHVAAGRPRGYSGEFPSLAQALREALGRQPLGTRSETWDADDPGPALGEWWQGLGELSSQGLASIRRALRHARRSPAPSRPGVSVPRPYDSRVA